MANIDISIVQWNDQILRSFIICWTIELGKHTYSYCKWDMVEQWNSLSITGYNIYRRDRADSYGGVAIIVQRSIQSYEVPVTCDNSGKEISCVKLVNCVSVEQLIGIYYPSSVWTVWTWQSNWDSIFSMFCKSTVVVGDFDGYHANCSVKTDTRGT